MNIAENLQLLLNTKESIRQAINEKAGDTLVESGTPFSAYSAAILSLCPADPCDIDPCSDPDCPGYDPVECGECDNDPCVSPDCPGYDECECEGTGCPDPCDEDPCSDPSCPGYDECTCEGTGCQECPESIPLGRYQFTLDGNGTVIQVEAVGTENYFNAADGCTPSEFSWDRTVYVYDSPTGTTPINTIWVEEYKTSDMGPEDICSNTNDNAGVIVWYGGGYQSAGGVQTGETQCDGVETLYLHCETAGTYYFELSGYTSPRFWDDAGNEMTPECLQAYDWNLYVEDFGLDDGGVQFFDNDPHELKVLFGETDEFGQFTSAGTVPYGEYTIGLFNSNQLTGSPTPEDCSMSLNGATLTDDGSAWYWTAVNMMRFDDSSIAVFDADGNLKLTTHITYGPM